MEESTKEIIQLPHDGIVKKIVISNLLDFLDIMEKEDKPFKLLAELENNLVGRKIRKIETTISIPLSSGKGIVVFSLSSYDKVDSIEIDKYILTYRYSSMIGE